jgi:hypothetical protein
MPSTPNSDLRQNVARSRKSSYSIYSGPLLSASNDFLLGVSGDPTYISI